MTSHDPIAKLAGVVGALLATSAFAFGCAHSEAADARAYAEAMRRVAANAYGVLQRDVNGDGRADIITAERIGPGYSVTLHVQRAGGEGPTFERHCTGPLVQGQSLDVLRWVGDEIGSMVLVLASDQTPDELAQSFALIDVADACNGRFAERLRMPLPGFARVGPDRQVPGGLVVEPNGLTLVDHPDVLHLAGPDGEVELLTGVRVRRLLLDGARVHVEERHEGLLRQVAIDVSWAPATDHGAPWVMPVGQPAELSLRAAVPVVLVEIHHGCQGSEDASLEVVSPDAPTTPFVTGDKPPAGSFVRAAGRSHEDAAGGQVELWALAQASSNLRLDVGPIARERCVREIKAYGWRDDVSFP